MFTLQSTILRLVAGKANSLLVCDDRIVQLNILVVKLILALSDTIWVVATAYRHIWFSLLLLTFEFYIYKPVDCSCFRMLSTTLNNIALYNYMYYFTCTYIVAKVRKMSSCIWCLHWAYMYCKLLKISSGITCNYKYYFCLDSLWYGDIVVTDGTLDWVGYGSYTYLCVSVLCARVIHVRRVHCSHSASPPRSGELLYNQTYLVTV